MEVGALTVFVIGFLAAVIFQSHPIARLTGLFCFPLGVLPVLRQVGCTPGQ